MPKYLTDYGILPTTLQKNVIVAVTDNGPDWNGKFIVNIINAGRLWLDCNLDCLIFVSYAASESKYNMMERCWSVINNTLSIKLPGEDTHPWTQGLSKEETQAII